MFVRLFARTLALLAADETTTTTAQASQGITAAYRIYDKDLCALHAANEITAISHGDSGMWACTKTAAGDLCVCVWVGVLVYARTRASS